MKILLLAVGKPRDRHLAGAIAEYEARAARYWPLEVHEVREEPARGSPTSLVCEREGERLLAKVPAGARLVACDPSGTGMTSEAFAAWLGEARDRAVSVAFAIGGAYGLSARIRERASVRLLLAPWTLTHELARAVLSEQLYRAGTIVRGEPYHK